MSTSLQQELHMKVPFDSLETEVFLNLTRTQSLLASRSEQLLKTHGITSFQYNVLRILQGAGKEGLPSLKIAERMVSRVPDITRLIDRLIKLELVRRERCEEDRRVVYVVIQTKGTQLLSRLHKPVIEANRARFKHMSRKQLKLLNDLLVEARQGE